MLWSLSPPPPSHVQSFLWRRLCRGRGGDAMITTYTRLLVSTTDALRGGWLRNKGQSFFFVCAARLPVQQSVVGDSECTNINT